MRRVTFPGVVLTFALITGACAPAPAATEMPVTIPTQSVPIPANTARPVVVVTEEPAETPTEAAVPPAPSESLTAESTEAPISTDNKVRISTSTSTGVGEPFLVDQAGRTLYLFTDDTQNSGTSSCTDQCLTEWPPVVVSGVPTAGTGVNPALLATITRDDDTMQATYNGWPLYYFSGDRAAGERAGQGMGNSWFMVSATGDAIQQ